ncbi:hypothetical protein GCM10027347_31950 [Larkinella harenae]
MSYWEKEPLVLVASAALGQRWSDQTCQLYMAQIPDTLHTRLNAYRNWEDKQRSVVGRLLLGHVLRRYGFSKETLHHVKAGRYGKPYIEHDFYFNIAHSAHQIVCVGSRTIEVGIDIEYRKQVDFADFESVMSSVQWRQINSSADPLAEFWRFWTVKEAIAKADGRGIGLPLDQITIDATVAQLDQRRWYVTELTRWKGYSGFMAGSQLVGRDDIRFEELRFDDSFSCP